MVIKKTFLIVLAKNQDLNPSLKTGEVKQTHLAIEELGEKRNNKWQLYQEDNKLEQHRQM